MHENRRARLVAYGVALLGPAVTLLVRWPLDVVRGDRVLYMTFFPAVIVAAYFGGVWPGLLATLLSALAANYFLVNPLFSLKIITVHDAVALTLFVLVGAIISGLSESLHRARRRIMADERQRAEEAVVQERYLLHTLMNNVPDNIYFKDTASRFVHINKSLANYFGLSDSAQAIGKTDFDFYTEEHARPAYLDEQEIIRSGKPVVGKEEKETWLDGRVRWVSTTKMPFRDRDGKIMGTFGVARDITEVKLTEKALRDSEHRWRSLTEALPQLVWTATPNGACDYFSTQWTEHTGVPESELLGWRWLEVLHPDDREPTRRFWLNSVAGRGPYDVEYRVRKQNGVYHWFKTRGVPIRESEGAICKWFGTCTDITDLRQTEEALRQANARLDEAVRGSNIAIWENDMPDGVLENGRLHAVNVWEPLGYDRPESPTVFAATMAIVHPDDRERMQRAIQAYLSGEKGEYEAEYRVRHRDGSYRWVLSRGIAVRDAAGKPIRFLGSRTDITDRKLAEKELFQAKNAAEAANRAKDEFLANVSHEIRTPMNAILGMTELTLDTKLTEDQRQCLKTVKSAADNLLGIINDLLDFSKIEAGKLDLDPTDFSLRSALGDTLRALAVRAHRKGLELVSHVQPDVPDALIGDAGRLRQVLLNLVGNAIKFTERGEVVIEVRRATTDHTDGTDKKEPRRQPEPPSSLSVSSVLSVVELLFSVRDTGIGIPPDKQETIFRAFEQEDTSTTRKYGGTGLGLTISARLAALMGGKITVDSQPGRGSTFTFTARFGRQARQPEPIAAMPPIPLGNLRVLIVDDNATNRHILEEWLGGWHMAPAAVGDGLAALNALWQAVSVGRPYPLVLLDERMPDTDGMTLAGRIREQAKLSGTRLIMLTSGDRPGDLARARALSISAHLLKPVQQEELLETIYQVMSKRVSGEVVRGECSEVATWQAPTTHHSPLTPALRILVAEDNEFNSQLLEKLLVRQGHRVQLAVNGREALTLAAKGGVDLLFLDIHMPELDGFQVVEAIREHEREAGGHLPVIALTARSRQEDRERCLAAGMDDFLAKPIAATDLWAALDRVAAARTPAARSEPDLLDAPVLLAACGGDAGMLAEICQTFRANLPDHLAAIQNALQEADAPRLREAAHKLCGMVAVFSTSVAAVASNLEDHAAEGRLDECWPLAKQLETDAQVLVQQIDGISIETFRNRAGTNFDPIQS